MRVPKTIPRLVALGGLRHGPWCPKATQAADSPGSTSIGTPARVVVEPNAHSTLVGHRATRQLIASATDADGSTRDLTRALTWVSLDPSVATVSAKGAGRSLMGNGKATIVARGGASSRRGDGRGLGDGVASSR